VGIRQLASGSEVSNRRFIWCEDEICEERTPSGAVLKRFFDQGMKIESGLAAGNYFYTRDHLGSIRELTDSSGAIRARYAYDPFGRSTQLIGDLEADFGFARTYFLSELRVNLTHYRVYNSETGRWLSRDPMDAEESTGHSPYVYAENDPINQIDPSGLQAILCHLLICGGGTHAVKDSQCLHQADVTRTQCILNASALDPGAYRQYRVDKCNREFQDAIAGCPLVCVPGRE
jgi:RHS repeat-associated protein